MCHIFKIHRMSRYVITAPAIMTAIEYRSGMYGSLFCTTAGSYSANALPPQTLYASINTEFLGVGIVQRFYLQPIRDYLLL